MQSENFDNKLRQAAEQHHPDYDEKAWTNMEKMLDRDLPQKDDRRKRVIFFMMLFLLLGGGAWLIVNKPWNPSDRTLTSATPPGQTETKPATASDQPAKVISPAATDEKTTSPDNNSNEPTDQEKVKNDDQSIGRVVIGRQKPIETVTGTRKTINKTIKPEKPLVVGKNNGEEITINVNDPARSKKEAGHLNDQPVQPVSDSYDRSSTTDKNKTDIDKPAANVVAETRTIDTKKEELTGQQPKTDDVRSTAKKSGVKNKNKFFFSLSLSPDLSSVGFNSPGSWKLLTGAGVGYTFRDRFTLRTGFYSGRKVYTAERDDYKFAVIPPNYQNLDKIYADCKVYEIPVNFAYSFKRSQKQSFFASAGLSSFIMHKEQYVYHYKTASGSGYSYTKSINNEYKHYFSIATLSAGYEHKISNTFSIAAEPYIKLPLRGVGYGNVKLTSAGAMFSLKMTPFQNSAKK